jgi:hypothetical protein
VAFETELEVAYPNQSKDALFHYTGSGPRQGDLVLIRDYGDRAQQPGGDHDREQAKRYRLA